MSRSHRKRPFRGLCSGSERWDKQRWHSLWRSREKQRLGSWLKAHESFEDFLPLTKNEVSDPYDFNKDGKLQWSETCQSYERLKAKAKKETNDEFMDYRHFRKFMMK